MSYVDTAVLKNSTIMLLYSEKDEINMNPHYQRMGGVWTKEKKRLLIDSILNDYDIPKIYFHALNNEDFSKSGFRYAVIDGRQRLEAIWGFMDGDFSLAPDFEYQRDPMLNLSNLSYEDIAKQFPRIRVKFDSFVLPVVTVSIDGNDLDLIEDMFSRLNEAVPLNAAEKRNAIGGNLVRVIGEISNHDFFTKKVKFPNNRYQHREISARFLLIEDSLNKNSSLVDTKKVYLDNLARKYHVQDEHYVQILKSSIISVISEMSDVFMENDDLLSAQGIMVVYFLLFKAAMERNQIDKISRRKLYDFRELLSRNRVDAENDYESASFELLEFDRLNQQGTNDASSIKERSRILGDRMGIDVESLWSD